MFRINLFFLFVVVPIAEIALLVQIGQFLGFWATMGLVVMTAAIGSSIAAREGTAALRGLSQMSPESVPLKLADAAIILVSGFLLLTPGIITDVVGLLGLFPVTRPLIRKFVMSQFGKHVKINPLGSVPPPRFGQSPGKPRESQASTDGNPIISGQANTTPEYSRADDDS